MGRGEAGMGAHGGAAVQLLLGRGCGLHLGGQVMAAYLRCARGMEGRDGPALRVLVTGDEAERTEADAVVVLSPDCRRHEFPADPAAGPIRLRLPVTPLSLRLALDYVIIRERKDRAAGQPDPKRAD